MPWSRIRAATKHDHARLELAAALFIKMQGSESCTGYKARATDPSSPPRLPLSARFTGGVIPSRLTPRSTASWQSFGELRRDGPLTEEASGLIDGYVVVGQSRDF